MASPSILRIERLNYVLGAGLALAAAITQSGPIALGVAVGAALTCLNFFVLRKLVVRWTTEAAQGKAGHSALLMLPKMIGLMGAVALSILLLPIDPVAFTVGYSTFIISIVIDTLYSALRPTPPSTEDRERHG
ncbi:MAG TPA: ATP synthase subunit I [Kofleriaceae bacterium]|nr:ATP synthase subunit I [Kofleriaceae bacterium]